MIKAILKHVFAGEPYAVSTLRIRYKIMLVVGIAVTLGLIAVGFFYTKHQEDAVLAQNERTMLKLSESVIQGLQSVMMSGSAEIAQSYADRLKKVPEIIDFRLMRTNGDEAFRDNNTILEVNRRRGEELFAPRDKEETIPVLSANDPNLQRAVRENKPFPVYEKDSHGVSLLSFYAPIENLSGCHKCHGKANPVRGVIKLTTSLLPVERDILKVRQQSMFVIAIALMAIMLLTGYMMGRTVVLPIEQVTEAMARVSSGDLNHKVPEGGQDELGRMATSFNRMTSELKVTYEGLKREQDKLTTIIFSAGEGIIVTDNDGVIVLVNPAAEKLLGKNAEQIVEQGFDNVFDDATAMQRWTQDNGGNPVTVEYKDQIFHLYASTITDENKRIVGSAALIRDITDEKRLEEQLRRLSTTDGLTGLYNRRFLDEAITTEFHRTLRTRSPLSVVMIDIDHFKKFNDTHGHDQGDRVLKAVAVAMRNALRKYDLPCRYGGEEFMAILPNTTAEGGLAVAERIRGNIEAMAVDGLKVTASLGIATFPTLNAESPAELIEWADQALYQSKEAGRNRSTVSTPV
jgi:diguanylate cyclase (GGDEF)-like protein/PAS domain S-box-containing protein